MKTIINWKVFFILWIAAIGATLLVLPYVIGMLPKAILDKIQIPLSTLIVLQTVQVLLLFAIAVFGGLFFAKRVGLATPILDSLTSGRSVTDQIRAILPISIGLGILSTLVLLGFEFFYFQPAMAKQLGTAAAAALNLQTGQPAAWKGFLASFYGGIAEEIQLRLFVMSFFVWLGRFISRTSDGKPTSAVFWIANIVAAVLFGLGHLPMTSLLVPITMLVVARAVVLNSLVGIVCGWLFWKRGLESAMVAHFSADLVLHVLLAL